MLTEPDLLLALRYAAHQHRAQKRKGTNDPYINHPIRVAQMSAQYGLSLDAQVAAILHDVVEDTDATLTDLTDLCTNQSLDIVDRLTKWWPDDALPGEKAKHKPTYYEKIAEKPEALALKLLDRADNLSEFHRSPDTMIKWGRKYWEKTQREITPLVELCHNEQVAVHYRIVVANAHEYLWKDLKECPDCKELDFICYDCATNPENNGWWMT